MFSKVQQENHLAQEASFHVAKSVAKSMKLHTLVESLIMLACKVKVKTLLNDEAKKVISRMSSYNNTVQRRIEMMSYDSYMNQQILLKKPN